MKKAELIYCYSYLFEEGHIFAGHSHATHSEINIVFDGKLGVTSGDSVYECCAGEMIIIPMGSFHSNRVTEGRARVTVMELSSESLPEHPMLVRLGERESSLLDILMRDIEERGSLREGKVLALSDTAASLLGVFIEYISEGENGLPELDDGESAIYRRARRYMLEGISKKLKISDIARAVGICDTSLKTLFSRYTGMGVIEFFNSLKLEEAQKRLTMGKSCETVSRELGFSSQAYFSRAFKRQYGIPPSRILSDA